MPLNILASLIVLATAGSAVAKLMKAPQLIESMGHVGVKPGLFPILALLEIAGAAGIILGIWLPILGQAAAVGVVLYFVGAVISHVRVKSGVKDAAPALVILVLAIATAILEFAR